VQAVQMRELLHHLLEQQHQEYPLALGSSQQERFHL